MQGQNALQPGSAAPRAEGAEEVFREDPEVARRYRAVELARLLLARVNAGE